ncbi:MAG: hypothetical protein KKH72_08015 [Alphaproteobacteria bacterium]|nr:hypothetical protein [Alphaproteobacteria bacterium]
MDDVLRKRLSEEELEKYDLYDRRASIAGHFVVWPGIAGLVSYFSSRPGSAIVCLVIVLAAFPVVVLMGRRASQLRELAEQRYGAIMGHSEDDGEGATKGGSGNNGTPGPKHADKRAEK